MTHSPRAVAEVEIRPGTGSFGSPRIEGLARTVSQAQARTMDIQDALHVVAPGPLVVSSANPRYFAVAGDGRIVYLTVRTSTATSRTGWVRVGTAPRSRSGSTSRPTSFLAARGHNFIRFWRWEQFEGYLPGADVHFCMTPQPWPRTGPGTASDGKPRFDLAQFDTAYFDRLRERVAAAARRACTRQ